MEKILMEYGTVFLFSCEERTCNPSAYSTFPSQYSMYIISPIYRVQRHPATLPHDFRNKAMRSLY